MSNTTNTSGGGIGFGGMLAIVFIILKLCHAINWSWWWVLAPLWIPGGIIVALLLLALVAYMCNI